MLYINKLYLIKIILKVTEAAAGTIGNKKLVQYWKLMNRTLMLYLKEHHCLLQILDDSTEKENEPNDFLSMLIAMEYGQQPNALLDLASTITEDVNEQHQLELVLDIARADDSIQVNLEKHLSLLDISQSNQPEASVEQQQPSLKDMGESQSQSSPTPSAKTEFLDIDPMEPLLQFNYDPNSARKMDNVTTEDGNTPNSPCLTELETQVKELSLALAAASSSSSNEKAACNMVMEEHLQRQKLEDSCTLNWQQEEKARM